MKKTLRKLVLITTILLVNITTQAQVGINRADKNYDKLAYFNAINIYEKVVKQGYTSPELLKNIGNSYYFNGEYQKANKWYSQLFNEFPNQEIEAEYFYRYGQTLKSIGDQANATLYLNKFALENNNSVRAKIIVSDKDYKTLVLSFFCPSLAHQCSI